MIQLPSVRDEDSGDLNTTVTKNYVSTNVYLMHSLNVVTNISRLSSFPSLFLSMKLWNSSLLFLSLYRTSKLSAGIKEYSSHVRLSSASLSRERTSKIYLVKM